MQLWRSEAFRRLGSLGSDFSNVPRDGTRLADRSDRFRDRLQKQTVSSYFLVAVAIQSRSQNAKGAPHQQLDVSEQLGPGRAREPCGVAGCGAACCNGSAERVKTGTRHGNVALRKKSRPMAPSVERRRPRLHGLCLHRSGPQPTSTNMYASIRVNLCAVRARQPPPSTAGGARSCAWEFCSISSCTGDLGQRGYRDTRK